LISGDEYSVWIDGDVICTENVDQIFKEISANSYAAMAPDLFLMAQRFKHEFDNRFSTETWAQYYERILPAKEFPIIYQAGVIVFRSADIKNNGILARLIKESFTNEYPGAPDQDILNVVMKNKIDNLDFTYNYVNHVENNFSSLHHLKNTHFMANHESWRQINSPKIIHFTGQDQHKPFKIFNKSRFAFRYYDEIKNTVCGTVIMQILAQNLSSDNHKQSSKLYGVEFVLKKIIKRIARIIYYKIPDRIRKSRKFIEIRILIFNWLN
jgi:lipopolysaccharide biosynthesis glycosyltransferase